MTRGPCPLRGSLRTLLRAVVFTLPRQQQSSALQRCQGSHVDQLSVEGYGTFSPRYILIRSCLEELSSEPINGICRRSGFTKVNLLFVKKTSLEYLNNLPTHSAKGTLFDDHVNSTWEQQEIHVGTRMQMMESIVYRRWSCGGKAFAF